MPVVWREARKVVGEVGLKLISREHQQGEIGFVFNPDGRTSSCTPSSLMGGERESRRQVLASPAETDTSYAG
jgi:hypothetical protein